MPNHFDKSWDIKEDILTFKAKANIDSGRPARQRRRAGGQAEAEFERPADQSRQFRRFSSCHVDEGATYTDILPSLNLYLRHRQAQRIRFAAAKVMARPRMDDMRANLVPGFNGGVCRSAAAGIAGRAR